MIENWMQSTQIEYVKWNMLRIWIFSEYIQWPFPFKQSYSEMKIFTVNFHFGITISIPHYSQCQTLTHSGWLMHICVSKLTIIGSDNGLLPGQRQGFVWTKAGILLIGPLGTNFSELFIEIHTISFTKMHLKMSSRKWGPFCLGLNELIHRINPTACPTQAMGTC